MRRVIALLSAVAFVAVFAIPAYAVTARGHADKAKPKPAASKKVVSAVCPVMGTKIPDVTKAAGKSVYKGKTYYFCCKSCKPKFDKNPEKYIKEKAPAKKKPKSGSHSR